MMLLCFPLCCSQLPFELLVWGCWPLKGGTRNALITQKSEEASQRGLAAAHFGGEQRNLSNNVVTCSWQRPDFENVSGLVAESQGPAFASRVCPRDSVCEWSQTSSSYKTCGRNRDDC